MRTRSPYQEEANIKWKARLSSSKRPTTPPARPSRPPRPSTPPPRPTTPPPYITKVGEDSGEDSDDSGMSCTRPLVDNYTDSDVESVILMCQNMDLEFVEDMFTNEINDFFDNAAKEAKEESNSPDDSNVSIEARPGTPGWGKFIKMAR